MKKSRNKAFNIGGPGVTIRGDIESSVDITVASNLEGNINCSATVFVNCGATVKGNIKAENIVVDDAEVIGDIVTADTTLMLKHAVVRGDINTKSLVIDEGAILNGKCNTREESTEATH